MKKVNRNVYLAQSKESSSTSPAVHALVHLHDDGGWGVADQRDRVEQWSGVDDGHVAE